MELRLSNDQREPEPDFSAGTIPEPPAGSLAPVAGFAPGELTSSVHPIAEIAAAKTIVVQNKAFECFSIFVLLEFAIECRRIWIQKTTNSGT